MPARKRDPKTASVGSPADVAQLVEHFTRKEGVRGSNPRVGFPSRVSGFTEVFSSGAEQGRRSSLNNRPHGAGGTDGHDFAGDRITREAIVSRPSLTGNRKDKGPQQPGQARAPSSAHCTPRLSTVAATVTPCG